MKRVMSPEGWEVSSQDKGHYLFMEPRRQFALRPDIVMKRGERTVILDTKWKSLVDNERANYGISQADMYQIYAYSKKYNTPEIWLLYPVNDEMRNHYPIQFESGDGTTVNLHFIDVDKEESLEELKSKLEAGDRMGNTKFDKLLGFLEPLETDSVGEWIIDKEHKGTEDDPIHFPYPMYTEVVNKLIEAVYEFEHDNPEYELTKYGELLKERGLEWGQRSMENADVSNMDAQGIMALLMGMVCDERFCDGAIMGMIKSGAVKKWLLRLQELKERP